MKRIQKWSALLMAVTLLFTLAAPAALAAESTVTIKTAGDLMELSRNCTLDTWSQGKTVILKNDLDLHGVDFTPIPTFSGTFQGNGHTISGLTLTGNKLKCFQIFILDDFSDELLFELGTLSPVGCVADHKHEYSPSQEYYDRIIRTHTISAFRNWKALALVDSFTVVAKGRTAAQMWVWPNSYFRLIYIHALYQKTLLFVVNRQFRSAANDRKSIRLLHKMKEQEHWYAFSNISYNFLPQLIYRAIDTGLDIATEREQLHRHLEQEAERLEKNSERRLAGLILFLTMLTVCSATYDGASLVKDYFGWESGTTPFRIFAALLLSAIVITSISVWHYRRNKS